MITKKKFIECIEHMQELDRMYTKLEHLGFCGIVEDFVENLFGKDLNLI